MYGSYLKSMRDLHGPSVESSLLKNRVSDVTFIDLFLSDGVGRTNLGARSAIGTFFFVDHVGFPLLNGLNRTFFKTESACHVFFGNNISHLNYLHS